MMGWVLVAAVLLRLTAVGEAATTTPAVLVLLFWALFARPARSWLAAGAIVGAVYGASVWIALAKWGALPALSLWLMVVAGFAAGLGAVGLLAERAPPHLRAPVIAAGWVLVLLVLDRALYSAVFLTAPWVLASSAARALVGWAGAIGAEGLVVLGAASLAAALRTRTWSAAAPALATVLVGAWASTRPPTPVEPGPQATLHMIQPSFSWRTYADRAWSLEARRQLVTDLEDLTREAAARAPGTIVWPENGTGRAEPQLAHRRARLQQLLASSASDLVTVGLVHEADALAIAAVRLTAAGVADSTEKARLVPLAEADVTPGQARVLDAAAGPLGVSICYDVLFGDHVRGLVDQGAEALVVSSDNASFGLSLIPRWHLAHAVLRAAEVQRSLVFGSNRGPVVAYDAASGAITTHSEEGQRAVASVQVPRRTEPRPAARHAAVAALLLLPGLLALRARGERRAVRRGRPRWRPAAVAVGAIVGAVLLEWGQTALVRGVPWVDVRRDVEARARGTEGLDTLARHFRQSRPTSCGTAALAYALTLLGDDVFEEDLAHHVPVDARGSRLSDLAAAAGRRGFHAEAVRAESLAALPLGPGRMALVHVQPEHYLVLTQVGARWAAFDPARGTVTEPALEALEQVWSGAALLVSHIAIE